MIHSEMLDKVVSTNKAFDTGILFAVRTWEPGSRLGIMNMPVQNINP
jgi:hypothetical protein